MVEPVPGPPLALKSCMVTGDPKSIMYSTYLLSESYVDLFWINIR